MWAIYLTCNDAKGKESIVRKRKRKRWKKNAQKGNQRYKNNEMRKIEGHFFRLTLVIHKSNDLGLGYACSRTLV